MSVSNNLLFTLIASNQSQKEVTANAALVAIDAIMNTAIIDRDLTAPPGSPAEGDLYIPKATATGDWAGHEGKVAYYLNAAWGFLVPNEGLTLYIADEDIIVTYDGAAWASPSMNNVPLLGINTTADATNKLAVASSALLFTNVGNGVQVKVNKAAAGDTASILFQSAFSGFAEMGLLGNNDFAFKVSPDNFTTPYTAMTIDKDTGLIDFPQGFLSANIVNKSYTFAGGGVSLGTNYISGFYQSNSTDANLTQASTTVIIGTANTGYGANAFLVAGAAGAASGGTGAVEIEISGTSVTDAGVRTTSDTEILVADITALSTDEYVQSTKRWIGQVTYTLQNAGGSTQTTFNVDFNYGLARFEHFGNKDFTIKEFEVNGLAAASDTGFNIRLLKHGSTGWTYAATGFVPGNGALVDWATEYSTEKNITNGEYFGLDRHSGIDAAVLGTAGEGVIIEITTGANNSVEYLNAQIGVII